MSASARRTVANFVGRPGRFWLYRYGEFQPPWWGWPASHRRPTASLALHPVVLMTDIVDLIDGAIDGLTSNDAMRWVPPEWVPPEDVSDGDWCRYPTCSCAGCIAHLRELAGHRMQHGGLPCRPPRDEETP